MTAANIQARRSMVEHSTRQHWTAADSGGDIAVQIMPLPRGPLCPYPAQQSSGQDRAGGRCNDFASSHGARIQTSHSSCVVRITGMAFGWIGSTIAFGDVVRKL
jgi:hypothetical protein